MRNLREVKRYEHGIRGESRRRASGAVCGCDEEHQQERYRRDLLLFCMMR
jgi:hypothetical protein